MSPLVKTALVATGAAIGGKYLGDYIAPQVPSVPAWLVSGGSMAVTIGLALKFTHRA